MGLQGPQKTFHRHPLAFLVEAADDICYTLIDFEDGINLGWIPEAYALEYLIKLVKDHIDTDKYKQLQTTTDRLAYLRALSIGVLIEDATRIFMEHEQEILAGGEFSHTLLKKQIHCSSRRYYQIEQRKNLSLRGGNRKRSERLSSDSSYFGSVESCRDSTV